MEDKRNEREEERTKEAWRRGQEEERIMWNSKGFTEQQRIHADSGLATRIIGKSAPRNRATKTALLPRGS